MMAIEVQRPEYVDIANLAAAVEWLAQAVSVVEVRTFRDKAEAVRVLARQRDLGREAENQAAELRIRADRRLGQLLLPLPKRHGARPSDRAELSESTPPTLADMGLNRDQAAAAQAIARVPEDEFEAHLQSTKAEGRRLASQPLIARGRTHARRSPTPAESAALDLEAMAERQRMRRLLRRSRLDLLSMPPREVLRAIQVRDHSELRAFIRDLRRWLSGLEAALDKPIRVVEER
jgi:hypothetical protein